MAFGSIAGLKAAIMGVTVHVDQASLNRVVAGLHGDARAANRAIPRALNKVVSSLRTEISRDVKTQINIRLAMTRKMYMRIYKAYPKHQVAELRLSGKKMNLAAYGHKVTPHGIKYRIKKRGRWTTISTAYFNPRTGRTLLRRAGRLYAPKGGLGARTWRSQVRARYPVRGLTGPALTKVLIGLPEYRKTSMDRRIGVKLQRELDRQVKVILQKRDAKRG